MSIITSTLQLNLLSVSLLYISRYLHTLYRNSINLSFQVLPLSLLTIKFYMIINSERSKTMQIICMHGNEYLHWNRIIARARKKMFISMLITAVSRLVVGAKKSCICDRQVSQATENGRHCAQKSKCSVQKCFAIIFCSNLICQLFAV